MSNIEDYISVRNEYIDSLKAEMLGPGSEISIPNKENELISDPPLSRYSMGILFPQGIKIGHDNDEKMDIDGSIESVDQSDQAEELLVEENENKKDLDDEKTGKKSIDDVDNLDEEVSLSTQSKPSSMGISFFVDNDCNGVNCTVNFATYRKAKMEDCRLPYKPSYEGDFKVPDEMDDLIYYDNEEKTLKIIKENLTKKEVRERLEKTHLEGADSELYYKIYKLCDQKNRGFVRVPHSVKIKIDFTNKDYVDDNKNLDGTSLKITGLKRKVNDRVSITLMLVNDETEKEMTSEKSMNSNLSSIFQSEIIVNTADNDFLFEDYQDYSNFNYLDQEEQSLKLLYRNKKIFASGLGTSCDWNVDSNGEGQIYTDFLPIKEVPQIDFNLQSDNEDMQKVLSMKYLSDLNDIDKSEKISLLKEYVKLYEQWIEELLNKKKTLDDKFNSIAQNNIDECLCSLGRMKKGIELLEKDNIAWDSFQLANRAMLMQRAHIKFQVSVADKDRFYDDEEVANFLDNVDYSEVERFVEDRYSWRPFQLAFIIMSIQSIVEDNSEDRKLVDLIWFPTGGGKTEAYLGLTAFTIFYRRMMHMEDSSGTTVIMRYTLRLLTAQQFTRASTLICACEYIRKDSKKKRPKYKNYDLGNEKITIGLWIGGEHTPNTNKNATENLKRLNNSDKFSLKTNKDKYNKFQVLKCPWCGTKMVKEVVDGKLVSSPFGYRMSRGKFQLFCPQEACPFEGSLPIQVVDEELYDNPPTLLFGTVDKFAMMPWRKETGNFFAAHNDNRPPELIIQDELHLISGPLGTIVGLYESIIEGICNHKKIMPKIVASTATIRKAKEQCASLYNREVAQFPSPALDAEDSFFAKEKVVDHSQNQYGRIYAGMMPSGKTKAMMEGRTIAALLQNIKEIDTTDEVKDKYWTLTAYFNSLRELGKCSSIVDDDVKNHINALSTRIGDYSNKRFVGQSDELTSRVATTKLNETLDKLEKNSYTSNKDDNKKYPSDIVLATNMISVGIDVARLNTMFIVGQPKLTSEYIQASSRIGREYPGVAFVLYDVTKSRDRSHYEQFKSYHESFYKYVEPTGATPFSKPARDRALHAVVIALLRHTIPELSEESDARNFSLEKYSKEVQIIKDYLTNRDKSIINKVYEGMDDDSESISQEIDSIFKEWERIISSSGDNVLEYGFKYMMKKPGENENRILKSFDKNDRQEGMNTMTSMRNVDVSVPGDMLIWEE